MLIVLGYSGHSFVVIDAAISNNIVVEGYFDMEESLLNPYNLKYFGLENQLELSKFSADVFIFPAVGDNRIRERLIALIESVNKNAINIIHKNSICSSLANIESFSFVGPGAIINTMVKIGKGAIINSGSIIEHECILSDFVHIAPGAVLAGNVNIGKRSFIGANSVIKQGISIGDDVVIGAGSVVLKDVPDGEVWVGNPATKLK